MEGIKDCDCIKNATEQILKMLQKRESNPKGFKIIDSVWQQITLYPNRRLFAKYEYESVFEKKDGTESKVKKESIAIHFSFCPFCGKKYN